MHCEELREFCLALPETTEKFPFDANTLVFNVGDKMFCLVDVEAFKSINLKCDPDKAIELREQYQAVEPGYHMNKKHWNTITVNDDVPDALLKEWIVDSYHLVIKNLPKSKRPKL